MSDLIERPDRLQLIRFADLVNRAPAPWLIEGLVRETSVVQLYGQRGSFKTFVAMSIGGAVATGVPWLGRVVRNSGLVVYVAAEGGGGIVQRARALSDQTGVHPSAFNMRFITEPMICAPDSDDMNVVVDRIREAIDWHPEGTFDEETGLTSEHPLAREWPQLIVIDTLARCLYGNENAPEDMGAFVQGIDRLKVEFNCTILILHHTGRDTSHERGHTSLGGACDTIYRLDAVKDSETNLLLSCEKMKDSRTPDPFELIKREVSVERRPSDDPNEDLTSIVIESAEAEADNSESELLLMLEEFGPLSWLDWLEMSQLSRATFGRRISKMRDTKQIIKENGLWRLSTLTSK